MSTPKSKKPSPLITPNSPKVSLWHQCKKCLIYLNQKDNYLHSCENLMQTKHAFISDNILYGFIENAETINNINVGVDKLVFMSLSAIQLCKFEIGEPVHLIDYENKKQIVKLVWPTIVKTLLSVQVSDYVLQNELKLKPLDRIKVQKLKQIPRPLLDVTVCSSQQNILQYDQDSLLIALQSQHRNAIIYVGQTINVIFYGVQLTFSVQKVTSMKQHRVSLNEIHSNIDSIGDYLQDLNLNEDNKDSKQQQQYELFYKILDSTKFNISNFKKKELKTELFSIDQIGGLDSVIDQMQTIINISLGKCTSVKGIKKSSGILIHGTTGTGKTLLIRSLASYINVHIVDIQVSDLFSKFYGEAESRLKQLFDEAIDQAPSIILIDNIDIPCNIKNKSDQERRVLSCLISQIDKLHELQYDSIVLATCSSIDSVDNALRRPGRFDQEIEILVPTKQQREIIFICLLKQINHSLSSDQIKQIAFVTHGFVGADINALISNASTQILLETNNAETACLTYAHLEKALTQVKPSAMRQVLVEVPDVKWTDIGGQEDVKLKLRQSVEWPLKHPEAFVRLGIAPPKGILMFGPPGCSKTMIAKALATESKLNFISVKGPELFRKYVGESERMVRDVFKRARQVSPSVIFFDELDALAGERAEGGSVTGGSNVQERVLAQMLTEMDGIVPLNNVTIVAATNRPDRIDKALLRPGRLDRLVYVPLPDEDTRRAIFNIRLRKTPLHNDVNVEELVQSTQNYSGAEIVAVCDEAALIALENDLKATVVSQQDFLTALSKVTPRTPKNLIQLYENYVKK